MKKWLAKRRRIAAMRFIVRHNAWTRELIASGDFKDDPGHWANRAHLATLTLIGVWQERNELYR